MGKVLIFLGSSFEEHSYFIKYIIQKFSDHKFEIVITNSNKFIVDNDVSTVIMMEFNYWFFISNKFLNMNTRYIYVAFEPYIVRIINHPLVLRKLRPFFECILTWNDSVVDKDKLQKFYSPYSPDALEVKSILNNYTFNSKLLVCQMSSNKASIASGEQYSLRKRINKASSKYFNNKLHFYGYGWKPHHNYMGSTLSKSRTLNNYKFTIVIENTVLEDGYITEKIFDAFYSECIPVYYGHDSVYKLLAEGSYIDMRMFIYNNKVDYIKLYTFLDNIDFETYMMYQQKIKQYLNSDEMIKFSYLSFFTSLKYSLERTNLTNTNPESKLSHIIFFLNLRIFELLFKLLTKIKYFWALGY